MAALDMGGVLGYEALTKHVEQFKFGANFQLSERLFPAEDIDSDVAKIDITDPSREVGQFTTAKSISLAKETVSSQSARCFRQFYHKAFTGLDLKTLRRLGSNARDRRGKALLARELLAMTRKVKMTNELLCALALRGSITVTVNDLSLTIDYGFASSHKPDVSETNPWSTTTNKISENLENWIRLINEDSGYAADMPTVWCHGTIMELVMRNDQVTNLLGGGSYVEQIVKTGYIPELFGARWRRYNGGYKNSAGTFVPWLSTTHVLITPSDGESGWADMASGIELVPNTDHSDLVEVNGMFSYSGKVDDDPPSIKVYVGDNKIPRILVPNAVVYAKVKA